MVILLKIFMGLYFRGSFNPLVLDQALDFTMQWFPLVLLLMLALYAGLRLCGPQAGASRVVRNDRRI